jgi:hypothetical protein
MTTTTARVEVLTAEVRVLMVGSRQVTLSVFGQLDQVQAHEVDPFGRVAPRQAEDETVYVVGASTRAADKGTLVRSARPTSAWLNWRVLRSRSAAEVIRAYEAWVAQGCPASITGTSPTWERYHERLEQYRADHGADSHRVLERGLPTHRPNAAKDLTAEARRLEAEAAQAALWEALPLIVLAGLR